MYAFEDHHAHRDSPEDVDGYVTCLLYTSDAADD